eukprot:c20277_g1_i1.p1 GENE.c20277_g1_i1~~c20277_g1_i1.p1  ORF type:complete len:474 (-),score=151.65 c20277_g1_i1:152-1573(-)
MILILTHHLNASSIPPGSFGNISGVTDQEDLARNCGVYSPFSSETQLSGLWAIRLFAIINGLEAAQSACHRYYLPRNFTCRLLSSIVDLLHNYSNQLAMRPIGMRPPLSSLVRSSLCLSLQGSTKFRDTLLPLITEDFSKIATAIGWEEDIACLILTTHYKISNVHPTDLWEGLAQVALENNSAAGSWYALMGEIFFNFSQMESIQSVQGSNIQYLFKQLKQIKPQSSVHIRHHNHIVTHATHVFEVSSDIVKKLLFLCLEIVVSALPAPPSGETSFSRRQRRGSVLGIPTQTNKSDQNLSHDMVILIKCDSWMKEATLVLKHGHRLHDVFLLSEAVTLISSTVLEVLKRQQRGNDNDPPITNLPNRLIDQLEWFQNEIPLCREKLNTCEKFLRQACYPSSSHSTAIPSSTITTSTTSLLPFSIDSQVKAYLLPYKNIWIFLCFFLGFRFRFHHKIITLLKRVFFLIWKKFFG